jgi:hypothetical protein
MFRHKFYDATDEEANEFALSKIVFVWRKIISPELVVHGEEGGGGDCLHPWDAGSIRRQGVNVMFPLYKQPDL